MLVAYGGCIICSINYTNKKEVNFFFFGGGGLVGFGYKTEKEIKKIKKWIKNLK